MFPISPIGKAPVAAAAYGDVGTAERILFRCRLINIAADAGAILQVEIAVTIDRSAAHHLFYQRVNGTVFLYAEIVLGYVQMPVYGVSNGRDVVGPVPRSLNVVGLCQYGNLPCLRNPADTDHIASDVVYQPPRNGGEALMPTLVELTKSDGH